MNRLTIPLFPLNTVLFPGGPLPLRVFEPRYLDMVSRCLKTNTAIGICLIQDGNETGEAAQTYDVGTLGHITYWQKRSDGLLGITVRGEQRFRICSRNVEPSQLIVAEVEPLPNDPMIPLSSDYDPMAGLLRGIMAQLDGPFGAMEKHYDDAAWVGARLVELLPLDLAQKQYFLQLDDAAQRLERLRAVLCDMELWPQDGAKTG